MINVVSIDSKFAHAVSYKNRGTIEESKLCGCFHCIRVFTPENVTDWADQGQTAKCSFCGIDSVIGDAAGVSIDKSFLERMHHLYFNYD